MFRNIYIYMLLMCLGLSYWYYAQNKIEELTKDNTQLSIGNSAYENRIKTMSSRIQVQQEQLEYYSEVTQKNAKTIQDLETLISKHDLEFLSLKKPELIEKRVNNTTRNLFLEVDNETANK